MRKIVFHLTTGMVGTDAWEFYEFEDGVTDEELSDFAYDLAKNNAEMYGIYSFSEYSDDPEITDEELDSEEYDDNIDGAWYDYNPEEHDGHTIGGTPVWSQA